MSAKAEPRSAARLVVVSPERAGLGAVGVLYAYGLLLCVPMLAAMAAISLLPFGLLTFLIPLLTLSAVTFFLPVGFGNPHVLRWVRPIRRETGGPDGFVVQLTLTPRLRSGLRAGIEDADDFGYLTFTSSALVFQGLAVKASFPFEQIQQVRRENIGWRGLFLCKQRMALVVRGLPGVASVEFAERSTWMLPASRALTRKLHDRLAEAVGAGSQPR